MLINKKNFNPKRFSSGELKLIRTDLNGYIINNTVDILYENKLSIFELFIIIEYYKKQGVKVNLILSYLPYQRMDHKNLQELDTLTYVAEIFNKLNLNSISICEPHSEILDFKNAKEIKLIEKLKPKVFKTINFDENSDFVVLTDKGGLKRYGNISKNIVYFNKERDKTTGLIIKHNIVGEIDVTKKIVIVDDIISTGDTLVNIVEYLTKLGAKQIYIMSGHIENNKYNKRLEKYNNVKQIFSTNTLKKKGNNKLKLYNIKELIYE